MKIRVVRRVVEEGTARFPPTMISKHIGGSR
jgi:hypothetical protein